MLSGCFKIVGGGSCYKLTALLIVAIFFLLLQTI